MYSKVTRIRAFNLLKDKVLKNLIDFQNFMLCIIPQVPDDRLKIDRLIDALDQMIEDIRMAETLGDLNEWFNLNELCENVEQLEGSMARPYSQEVMNLMSGVSESYKIPD